MCGPDHTLISLFPKLASKSDRHCTCYLLGVLSYYHSMNTLIVCGTYLVCYPVTIYEHCNCVCYLLGVLSYYNCNNTVTVCATYLVCYPITIYEHCNCVCYLLGVLSYYNCNNSAILKSFILPTLSIPNARTPCRSDRC